MSRAVKLSEEFISAARATSKILNRSLSGQVEYWARIGKAVEENPDINNSFLKNILLKDMGIISKSQKASKKSVTKHTDVTVSKQRKLGAWKGKVWMSDDFDEPLPEEIMRYFE